MLLWVPKCAHARPSQSDSTESATALRAEAGPPPCTERPRGNPDASSVLSVLKAFFLMNPKFGRDGPRHLPWSRGQSTANPTALPPYSVSSPRTRSDSPQSSDCDEPDGWDGAPAGSRPALDLAEFGPVVSCSEHLSRELGREVADFQINDLPAGAPLDTDELEAQRAASGPSIKFSLADLRGFFASQGSASVLDYGADPSGTADSAGAMNSAIADLGVQGGTVLVPPGIYRIDSSIEILRSNVCLIVEAGATIIAGAGFAGRDGSMLAIGDGVLQLSNIVIKGPGLLDGDRSPGAVRAVSALGPLNRVVIDGLSVTRTLGTKAIAVSGMSQASPARNIIIRGNFLDEVYEGIVIREVNDFSIEANRITDNLSFGQDAIETVNCQNGIIANNAIRNVGAGNAGIELFESAENIVISSNLLLQTEDRNGGGSSPCQAISLLSFEPGHVHANVQVIGNQIRGAWATGVRPSTLR